MGRSANKQSRHQKLASFRSELPLPSSTRRRVDEQPPLPQFLSTHSSFKMPTSPLDPSHTTQFKSTIRKPQQSSAPSGSSSASWPSSGFLSQASFDPASWTYLAEGGKSLLLRFDGDHEQARNGWLNHNATRALALRMGKIPREAAGSSTAATSSSSSQGVDRGAFEDQVIAPLLARKSLLPSSLSLKLPDGVFLEKTSGKIEMSRPKKRRAVDGIDVQAFAVEAIEDLTWCLPGDELLAVEIKVSSHC